MAESVPIEVATEHCEQALVVRFVICRKPTAWFLRSSGSPIGSDTPRLGTPQATTPVSPGTPALHGRSQTEPKEGLGIGYQETIAWKDSEPTFELFHVSTTFEV